MTSTLTKEQLAKISSLVKNKELSLADAQRIAYQKLLQKKGLVSFQDVASELGRPLNEKNDHYLKNQVQGKNFTPQDLLALLKSKAVRLSELTEKTALNESKARHYVQVLESYGLIAYLSEMECIAQYLKTLKNYSIGKFKRSVLPYLKKRVSEDDLRKNDLIVITQPNLAKQHAIKKTGRESYIEYANLAAEKFAEKFKDRSCLNEMIRLEFGLTPKTTTFKNLVKTTQTEMTFENKFRDLMIKLVHEVSPNAACTEEEHAEDEGVLPDTLVTLPDGRKIALELKRSSQGFYVDTSIKQFLRYLSVYDFVGIIGFYDLPSIASSLGSERFTGEEFLDRLKDYFDERVKERKKERDKYPRELPLDHEDFCDKVDATNTYLAYRYARKQLDKFKPGKETIQVLIGPEAFEVFNPGYEKKADKVFIFLGGASLSLLCTQFGLNDELKKVKLFDEHLRELMKKSKL